jgi:predicted MFS family arabinose efflux permease
VPRGVRLADVKMPPGPLRSRNFRLLLACGVISVTGTAVAVVATPFAVLAIGGSAADVGYVAAAVLLPALIFPLGGVVADRLPRHQVMMAANVLQALGQAMAAVLVLTGQARVWELVVLAAARGVGYAFYFPAAGGLLPQTVPADQRAAANAMYRIGLNTSQIGGSALGGVLVALAGPGWGLAVDAATYLAAAVLRVGMRFPDLSPVPKTAMLRDLREGWRDFVSRRWLWPIVLAFGLIVAVSTAATSVLGPVVAHTQLGGPRSWGIILAAYAAGAVLGGLVMLRFRPQRILLAAMLSVPAFSVFLFALAVPLAVAWIAAAALLAGGCQEVFTVNWATTMQQEIPPSMLSRLSSYDLLGSFALAPIGAAVAGPAGNAFGIPAVITAGGILILLLTAAVLLIPEVRNMQRQLPALLSPAGRAAP